MRVRLLVLSVLALSASLPALAMPDCSLKSALPAAPMSAISLPPLSDDLPGAGHALGLPDDVLAYAGFQDQSVDRVLARIRAEACAPSPLAAPVAGTNANGYVPRTKWDNTPYRFSAGGNGKKFTAADFDAWMAAKGIHISKGPPAAGAAAPASTPPASGAAAPPQK
ncbi:MAG: hypothetical protein JSS44_06520 [Proteobacteria bacterium]|nr:hypothetical protein [Pseudomonadota bacterium]MBS0461340.1 hypothetical protein [Pseudomonadota bacterium]MBS0463401.1 hypothetical protein [Pseudomonadota bacterium]